MATAKTVMNKAISFLGTKESPANSNNVVFNTHYYGKKVSGAAYPWCAAYVWDVFRLAGASDLFYDGKKTAYCPAIETWGKQKKLTVDKTKGQYGDIVLFDFYKKGISCHIGLIEKKNPDGSYVVVEGNTSLTSNDNGGSVMRRNRSVSQIRCIIRPKYKKVATTNAQTDAKCNFYKQPNTWDGLYTGLSVNTKINVVSDCGDGWSKVEYNGETGYVKNSCIAMDDKKKLSSYPTKKTTKEVVFRSDRKVEPSTEIEKIKEGTEFKAVGKDSKWVEAKIGDKTGYLWLDKTNA